MSLSDQQLIAMYRDRKAGMTILACSIKYGIDVTLCRRMLNGETRGHLLRDFEMGRV